MFKSKWPLWRINIMKTKGLIIASALAVLVTGAYCIAAWYLSALWSTLVVDQESIVQLSAYTIKPLPLSLEFRMLHWQLLAVTSLVINLIWGFRRVRLTGGDSSFSLPLCCHLSLLLFSLFMHLAGGLACFVAIGYQIL